VLAAVSLASVSKRPSVEVGTRSQRKSTTFRLMWTSSNGIKDRVVGTYSVVLINDVWVVDGYVASVPNEPEG